MDIETFTLGNAGGMVVRLIGLGATVTQVHAPDRDGALADVTLGYDEPSAYLGGSAYYGAIVGRCANRIAGGRFELDGASYELATNNGPNHLHGGEHGFDARVWDGEPVSDARGEAVRFSRVSPDGEEGYPGTLSASVLYVLTTDNRLLCEIEASSDAATLCNLVQHAYWNLAGHDAGSIAGHELTLFASAYTPMDGAQIPTGEVASVRGTPFDFRAGKPIARDWAGLCGDRDGYDHNFVVDGEALAMRRVARVVEPGSGRVLELRADQPGVQVYTGNYLGGGLDGSERGKGGASYGRHAGFCLETQRFPNAVNEPGWVGTVLRPGETYRHRMEFAFSTDRDA
jgi:aldose 1-epimerase